MNREQLKELGLTDEQIESVMKSHGKAIQAVKPADDYEELQKNNATLEQELNDLKTTLDTHQDELNSVDDLKKEVETYKLKDLKTSIAIQAGIPFDLAGRLSGATEEEIKADAEKLAGFVNKKPPLPLKPTEPNVNDKDAGLKNMLKNMNDNKGE